MICQSYTAWCQQLRKLHKQQMCDSSGSVMDKLTGTKKVGPLQPNLIALTPLLVTKYLNCASKKDTQIIHQPRQLANPISLSNYSPHLLCSGLVVRYQFKTYPKPDRTCPRPLSWSRYWHRVVAALCSEGTYHIRHVYHAVGRAVAICNA